MTRFSIRPQAVLLAGVPLVCLLFVLALAGLLIKQTQRAGQLTGVIAQSSQVMSSLSAANRYAQIYYKSRNTADLRGLPAAIAKLHADEAALRASVAKEARLTGVTSDYIRAIESGAAIITTFVSKMESGDKAGALAMSTQPHTRQVGADILKTRVALEKGVQQAILGSPVENRASLLRLEQWLFIGSFVGIVLTIGVSWLFGLRIVDRLQRLATNARRLAAGEPALAVGGNDELSDLDGVYRSMAERIAESSRAHAEALEHLERERRVATLLQQTLLPQIPAIDGLRIDSAYATPPDGARVGGDWFDVFALSDRLVGLSVGDVTGHSLAAVASMGFVRQAIRVVARMRPDPAHVLALVNRIVCDEAGSISTAFFGVYDRFDGSLRYALAGHCPPLIFSADGRAEPLAGDGLLPGLDSDTHFAEYRRSLVPGETLVLYTDGAVEVERDYLKGMIDLENAIRAELSDPFENVAERVQRRIFELHAPLDDSALLVVSVDALATSANAVAAPHRFDARDREIAHRVKRELIGALRALPAPPDIDAAELVYGELISNVVRHTPGPARVWFDAYPDRVVLNVEDAAPPFYANGALSGNGAPPDATAEGGRGLYIVRALSEHVAIDPVPGGKRTSVTLRSLPRDESLRPTG